MDKKVLIEKLKNARSTMVLERTLIQVFEDMNYKNNHIDFEAFKRELGSDIAVYISKTLGDGRGIVEILEDHYKK